MALFDNPLSLFGNIGLQQQGIARVQELQQELSSPNGYLIEQDIAARQSEYQALIGKLKKDELLDSGFSHLEAINNRRHQLQAINLSKFNIDVDDADTLVLTRKGLLSDKKPILIRLAGIDAPETTHTGSIPDPLEPYRVNQAMPGGKEATQWLKTRLKAGNLQVIIDPAQMTYGRYVGAAYSGESNIALEMVQAGLASSLEYGSEAKDVVNREVFSKAGSQAEQTGAGIWSLPYYQRFRAYSQATGRDPTFNMLTSGIALAKNSRLMGLASSMWGTLSNQPINSIEGFRTSNMQPLDTDFRSPWQGLGKLMKSIGGFFRDSLISKSMPTNYAHEAVAGLAKYPGLARNRGTRISLDISKAASIFGTERRYERVMELLPSHVRSKTALISPELSKMFDPRQEGSAGLNYPTEKLVSILKLYEKPGSWQVMGSTPTPEKLAEASRILSFAEAGLARGDKTLSMVTMFKNETAKDITSTALHEYGHYLTRTAPKAQLSSTSKSVLASSQTITPFVSATEAMSDIIADPEMVKSEMMAESIGAALQQKLGFKTPEFAKSYYSRDLTESEMLSMQVVGNKILNTIPAGDDAYNMIEALSHGGDAERMRRKMLIPFGSGFTEGLKAFGQKITGFVKGIFSPYSRASQAISKLPEAIQRSVYVVPDKLRNRLFPKSWEESGRAVHLERLQELQSNIKGASPTIQQQYKDFLGHIAKMPEDANYVPLVFARSQGLGSSSKEYIQIALHEYGHAITLSPSQNFLKREVNELVDPLTKYGKSQLADVHPNMMSVKESLFSRFQDPGFVKTHAPSELAAEAVGVSLQKSLGYEPRVVKNYYSSKPGESDVEALGALGTKILDIVGMGSSRLNSFSTLPTESLEAFTHQGVSGMTRRSNTGFGSGWRGLESTIDAMIGFSGFDMGTLLKPISNALPSGPSEYNYPPVVVSIQSASSQRSHVDSTLTALNNVNYNRKLRDRTRKQGMADEQSRTLMRNFHNANRGGKRHIN